jgi:hypothetical protein
MPCSRCGLAGHNVRTCVGSEPDFIPFDREIRELDATEDFNEGDVEMGIEDLTGNGSDMNDGGVEGELEEGFTLHISGSDSEMDDSDTEEVPDVISTDTTPTTPYECPICMETKCENRDGVVKLGCTHKFCTKCFVIHMRVANQCAMCRRKVCAKPKKKHMSASDRFDIVSELVWNSPMAEDIHERIMNNARTNLIKASGNVETRFVRETMGRIKDFVKEEDIRKASLMTAFLVTERVSGWYGDKSSAHIRVNWGGHRFHIA